MYVMDGAARGNSSLVDENGKQSKMVGKKMRVRPYIKNDCGDVIDV